MAIENTHRPWKAASAENFISRSLRGKGHFIIYLVKDES